MRRTKHLFGVASPVSNRSVKYRYISRPIAPGLCDIDFVFSAGNFHVQAKTAAMTNKEIKRLVRGCMTAVVDASLKPGESIYCPRAKYLYYCDDVHHVALACRRGLQGSEEKPIVLTEDPLSMYKPGLRVLKVNIQGLSNIRATRLKKSPTVLFYGSIPIMYDTPKRTTWRMHDVTSKIAKLYDTRITNNEEEDNTCN